MRDIKFPHCDAFHPNWHGHSPSLVCLRQSLCQTFTEYSLEGIRSFNGRILTGRKYYTGNQCSECESGLIVCCRLQYTEASTYVPSICPRCVYCRTLFYVPRTLFINSVHSVRVLASVHGSSQFHERNVSHSP